MARYELFQSQTTLVMSLLTDTAKLEIRKTFTSSYDESHLTIKSDDTQIHMVLKSVIRTLTCMVVIDYLLK